MLLLTLPTRKNSTHQARFILCEVSRTRSAETPQPSSSRFRTAITIPRVTKSSLTGNSSRGFINKLQKRTSWEGGKRSYTLLPIPDPSAPPLTSQSHHLQFINKLQIEQVGKGASGTTRFSPQRTRARPRSIQLMPDKL